MENDDIQNYVDYLLDKKTIKKDNKDDFKNPKPASNMINFTGKYLDALFENWVK